MSNYSDREDDVRVDFFKDSGKWYTAEKVRWTGSFGKVSLQESFAKTLINHLARDGEMPRMMDMTAVCLEPYHRHAFPVMMKVSEAFR